MAGIGFELKKIYRKESISRGMLGVVYSSLVTIGPMMLVIVAILLLYFFLGMTKVPYADRELLSSTILYTFIFSVILTSPFNVIFSRYLADKFYTEEYSNILASYYMGNSICCIIATLLFLPVGWSLRVRGEIDLPFIIAAYIQWISLVILFFAVIYLHATKDYKIIALFFVIGMAVSFLVSFAFYKVAGQDAIHSIIYGLSLGFFLIAVCDFSYIKRYFKSVSNEYGECMHYLWSFKRLLGANFLYILGLYVHNFVFWTTDLHMVVAKSFVCVTSYDMATCIAMFTNISSSVIFIARVEMHFHERYKAYSEAVIGGRGMDIELTQKRMFRQLAEELMNLTRIQFIISLVLFFICIIFLPQFGFGGLIMRIYPCLAAGYFIMFLLYAEIIFLYYFNDLTGSVLTSIAFCGCTALGSMIAVNLPDIWYGTGLVVGAFLGFTVAYLRLQWLEKHMDVHVFCNGNLLKRKNEKCPPFKVYDRREAEERKEEN